MNELTPPGLAYRDPTFLDSDEGRCVRILSEYLAPLSRLLYGSAYWRELINFDALVRHGMVDPAHSPLYCDVDTPDDAFSALTALSAEPELRSPAFAESRSSDSGLS